MTESPEKRRLWITILVAGPIVWGVLALFFILEFHDHLPKTALGWALLVGLGPPLYIALEWLGTRIHPVEKGTGRAIFPARFSFTRIAIGTVVGVLFVIGMVLLGSLLHRA